MAEIKITTMFDRTNQRMRLVFSEKTDYLEMPLDRAIAVLTEVISRCQAHKVAGGPAPKKEHPQ